MTMDIDQQTTLNGDQENSSKTYSMKIFNKGHKLSLTCVCIDSNDKFAFSGSKCGTIVKWNMETKKILKTIKGRGKDDCSASLIKHHHNRHVNCLALSSDNKYLVSGGYDRLIRVWNPEDMSLLHVFKGHLNEVTGLVFRQNCYQLYSASADKTVKLWVMDEEPWSYAQSLFGHESCITSLDALDKEKVLSSGGRDGTVRIFKIVEDSQTVFQSNHKSVDIVKYIDERHFVSGGEDGHIAVWSTAKRTPLASVAHAHEPKESGLPWVTSIATYSSNKCPPQENAARSFTIASGSSDGKLNIWKSNLTEGRKLDLALSIPINGVINWLVFNKDGSKIVAAVGQEHRFGRWWRVKGSKNAVYVINLKTNV